MSADIFHRIVVPIDFSDSSEPAWALAQRLARALGSEIVLAHVLVEAPLYGEGPLTMDRTRQVLAETRTWAAQQLDRRAAVATANGLAVRTALRTGSPYREIVDLATDERADLVILGTHGRGGLIRAVLGSVADRVVRLAPCAVLTVRQPE
jgi:nucleotide-binding universal stress UspA family protein